MSRKTRPTTSVLGSGAIAGFALWRLAMAWQRSVDRALRPLGLTHTRLLVLSALDSASKRVGEQVSQAAIAAEAGLDKVTVSTVLRALESRGLVGRDVGFGDDRMWHIMLTSKGERVLASAVPLVEQASSVLPRRGREESGR
jgi:MarR family transcriptional regulator, organic hydroperoxide resistance regulator